MQKLLKTRLPKKLIIFENTDKKWHESWHAGRDELNIPHPARICLIGKPNSGKGVGVKNLVMRADPPFEEVILIHPDSEGTTEFDILEGLTVIDEVPSPKEFDGKVKTCIILDDIDFDGLDKEQTSNLCQLFKHVSTHKNVTVILSCHTFHPIPAQVRRATNFWVLWKSVDSTAINRLAAKVGSNAKKLTAMFDAYITKQHDSLWIDQTSMSPYPFRKNGYEIISNESTEEKQREKLSEQRKARRRAKKYSEADERLQRLEEQAEFRRMMRRK